MKGGWGGLNPSRCFLNHINIRALCKACHDVAIFVKMLNLTVQKVKGIGIMLDPTTPMTSGIILSLQLPRKVE